MKVEYSNIYNWRDYEKIIAEDRREWLMKALVIPYIMVRFFEKIL